MSAASRRIRWKYSGLLMGTSILWALSGCKSAESNKNLDSSDATLANVATNSNVKLPRPATLNPPPHHDVQGPDAAKAQVFFLSFADYLKGHNAPNQNTGVSSYEISDLNCRNMWVPALPQGFYCTVIYRNESGSAGSFTTLTDKAPSPSAKSLYESLKAAGISEYVDMAHGSYIAAKQMTASKSELHFDDYANYSPSLPFNIAVTGTLASDMINVLNEAQIDDTDGSLFVICNKEINVTCGVQIHGGVGQNFSPALANKFWQATTAAALSQNFKPASGTIQQITTLNVRNFTFDGMTLRFKLSAAQ